MKNLILYVGFGVFFLLLTLVVSFVTVDWGLAEGYGEPYWGDSEEIIEGQKLITGAGCLQCHSYRGQLGQVTGPTLDDVGLRMNKQIIETFIRHGSGVMPGYEGKLTDEEIEHLSNWLSTFQSPYSER
ncbi:MAG: cytochrome c [Bacillus sp. (in: Bacteria)]|nr:cytochrome c [Bacillus sp. (in: firmicutes)]